MSNLEPYVRDHGLHQDWNTFSYVRLSGESDHQLALKVCGIFFCWVTPFGQHGWGAWATATPTFADHGNLVWLGLYPDWRTAARACERHHDAYVPSKSKRK